MRQVYVLLTLVLGLSGWGQFAAANCLIISQMDQLHAIQSRLARNPDTALFATDIRQLRVLSNGIGDRDAIEAVSGNAIAGKGAVFAQLMQDTRDLLQQVSLDDPQSVHRHFTRTKRNTLQRVRDYLPDVRCTQSQIDIAGAQAAENPSPASSDAEDLAEVADNLRVLADEVFRLRTLVIGLALGLTFAIAVPVMRRWLILRKRRAKRHNIHFDTQYRCDDHTTDAPLLDINCFGAKLRHGRPEPMGIGDQVDIFFAGDWHQSAVMWSNLNYAGVAFASAITLDQVKTICDQSNANT